MNIAIMYYHIVKIYTGHTPSPSQEGNSFTHADQTKLQRVE